MLRLILITVGPPVRVFLVFDPWLTHGSAPTDYCACGFKLPDGVIDTIDSVTLVETGTSTPIPGFSFVVDSDTSGDIEALLNSGPGATWHAFSSDQTLAVPPGVSADFRVEATLLPGVTLDQLFGAIGANSLTDLVYTDEANPDGTLAGTHGGSTDVSSLICDDCSPGTVPTASTWGMIALGLLFVTAASVTVRRRRGAPLGSES